MEQFAIAYHPLDSEKPQKFKEDLKLYVQPKYTHA